MVPGLLANISGTESFEMKSQIWDTVLSTVRDKKMGVIWTKFDSLKPNAQFSCLLLEKCTAKFSDVSVGEYLFAVLRGKLKVEVTSTNAVFVMVESHGETSKNF